MKTRAIIQARMLSARLRGKTLMSVGGVPLLYRVVQNVKKFTALDSIMIATTKSESDDPIASAVGSLQVEIYRGDSVHVLKRFIDASADMEEEDVILRYTADNPVYDESITQQVYDFFVEGNFDYVCIDGLSHVVPEFIKVRALREMYSLVENEFDKEHVTPYFRKHADDFKVHILPADFGGLIPHLDKYLTIDTEHELHRFEKMFIDLKFEKENTLQKIYLWIEKYLQESIDYHEFVVDLDGKFVGKNKPVYIIAEIGQNHNGDIEIAKQLIELAASCGADAVKFQKRDLANELTKVVADSPYENPHSFGKTYGEHRAFLELNEDQHAILKAYAHQNQLSYICTACDIPSVEMLERLHVPFYKVASRDLTNIPLLECIAQTKKPVIISTGMAGEKEIEEALKVLGEQNKDVIILHCISEYPAEIEHINLNAIKTIQEKYKKITGYSDHTTGIIAPVIAATLGAAVIEKHITLSRAMKGTDHAGSLEEPGLRKMIEYIRLMQKSLGDGKIEIHPASKQAKEKLARSITSKIEIKKGEIIREEMLVLKSPGTGLQWSERNKIIGKKVRENINADTTILLKYIEETND